MAGITTKDLADACGVSRATVTRALYGTGRISAQTREQILRKARELGYEPDLVARSLVSGQSMMIGVTIVDLNNLYFPSIVDAIEKRVRAEDYLLNITLHEDSRELERKLIRMLVGHRMDGLILNPVNKGENFRRMMKNIHIPYCVLGLRELTDCPAVGVDEYRAGRAAAEYIVQRGYEYLVFVAPQLTDDLGEPNFGHFRRWEGIQDALRQTQCGCSVVQNLDYCEKTMAVLKRENTKKAAILCSGAVYSVELLERMTKAGYRVLQDFGIMTFDRIDLYKFHEMKLTTVDNHPELQGEYAADMLIRMIKNKNNGIYENDKLQREVPFEIIEGQTL